MHHDRDGGKRVNWLLIKHHDDHAFEGDGTAVLDQGTSVASGRTIEAIAGGKRRKPKPFMVSGDAIAADAVWDSNVGLLI